MVEERIAKIAKKNRPVSKNKNLVSFVEPL
jgi:hypothetical protein